MKAIKYQLPAARRKRKQERELQKAKAQADKEAAEKQRVEERKRKSQWEADNPGSNQLYSALGEDWCNAGTSKTINGRAYFESSLDDYGEKEVCADRNSAQLKHYYKNGMIWDGNGWVKGEATSGDTIANTTQGGKRKTKKRRGGKRRRKTKRKSRRKTKKRRKKRRKKKTKRRRR